MIDLVRILLTAVAAAAVAGLGLVWLLRLARARIRRQAMEPRRRLRAWTFVALLALEAAAVVWGVFEPSWLEIEIQEVSVASLPAGQRLRIAHLSDLHLDGDDPAADQLPPRVAELQPDLVIVTGDLVNSPQQVGRLRELLAAIPARLGRFVVRGNHDRQLGPGALEGVATELSGVPVPVAGLALCGANVDEPERLLGCLASAQGSTAVAAFHTPDLVEDAAALGPALYLAGHTHGGQIRLPLYGAIVTLARHGKRYEAGRYRVQDTTVYVSRGIGLEPRPAPQVRFLCRPELAVIDLVGGATPVASP